MVYERRRRVLLVDDDERVRIALGRLLGSHGFECTGFASAETLLAGDCDDGACCIVSDFHLPGLSGLQLLEVLRDRGGWPPLILITGHGRAGLRSKALRRGASGYLSKPIDEDELLNAIAVATTPVWLGDRPRAAVPVAGSQGGEPID